MIIYVTVVWDLLLYNVFLIEIILKKISLVLVQIALMSPFILCWEQSVAAWHCACLMTTTCTGCPKKRGIYKS